MVAGEDERSVEKNLEVIVAECKKRQPDKALLMVRNWTLLKFVIKFLQYIINDYLQTSSIYLHY